MGMSVSDVSDEYQTAINVVPLVDIMLVLLIIFIITLPVMTHAVKIDLPRATDAPPPDVKSEPINIDVSYNGAVLWNNSPVTPTELRLKIKDEAVKDPQPEVHLSVDRRAKYEAAATVLFAVQRGGLKKIGFVADASGAL
ncbi:MAG: biopolymer transporter ExbD [Pseudomonadota bacterium]